MHHHKHTPNVDRSERGAAMVEYGLLLALIAVVVFSATAYFGQENGAGFDKSGSCIDFQVNGGPDPGNC